jgi:type IV pilus assembly protein PilX|tara:strand:- start:17 stop:565 length:549 start_codon:yes stop_codon:yes gene_type:complete
MNTQINNNSRKGFIIVISLTLMLVMMTMGIGLYFSSKQASEMVGKNVNKSDSFYAAESCIVDARSWLKAQAASGIPCKSSTAGALCHTVTSQSMSKWVLSAESQTFKNRAQSQTYTCTIALLGTVAYEGGEGSGFDVGEGGYGGSTTNTKYMYRTRSRGIISSNSGFNDFESSVEVIDSMIF